MRGPVSSGMQCGDPVDQVKAAGHLVERAVEPEEADDTVDVEGEYRAVVRHGGGE